ncbi:MAG: hypothetical protein QOJ99_3327 [Bryobacterales bacterium]|jgi:hypothetical protein|nr:hypothetical protein [Bryobacterales bacterium]
MSILERRFENRFLCADLVSVIWSDAAPPEGGCALGKTDSFQTDAVLEDISALGACVQVEQSIPIGSPITLAIGKTSFSGRVCYSVFRDYGHFAGIRFSEDTEWSAEMVMPQHLINLETIAQLATR